MPVLLVAPIRCVPPQRLVVSPLGQGSAIDQLEGPARCPLGAQYPLLLSSGLHTKIWQIDRPTAVQMDRQPISVKAYGDRRTKTANEMVTWARW